MERGTLPKITRGTKTLQETAKEIETRVAEWNLTGALAEPMLICFVCSRRGTKMRVINKRERLAICIHCDYTAPEEKPITLKRATPRKILSLDEAACYICGNPIINQKEVERKLRQKTRSGAITERDKERILKEIRTHGWKNIGQEKYVHEKCLRGRKGL